jgi:predicted nucleic acid-binding protein
MKAVVDTNVVAYALLGTETFVDEATTCLARVTRPLAPTHWEAELANVLWMAVRARILTGEEAAARLGLARRLGIDSVPTAALVQSALLRAVASGVSVYDTLFIELAVRERCPMATFDKAVLKAFPDVAVRPSKLGLA